MTKTKEFIDKTAKIKKDIDKLNHSRLGWLALGVVLDYLVGRPARKLKPIIIFLAGMLAGAIYVENILPKIAQLLFG